MSGTDLSAGGAKIPITWNSIDIEAAVKGIESKSGEIQLGTIIKKVRELHPELEGSSDYEIAQNLAKKLTEVKVNKQTKDLLVTAFQNWTGLKTADYATRVAIQIAEKQFHPGGISLPDRLIKLKEGINTIKMAVLNLNPHEKRKTNLEISLKLPVLLDDWKKSQPFSLQSIEARKAIDRLMADTSNAKTVDQKKLSEIKKMVDEEIQETNKIPESFTVADFHPGIQKRIDLLLKSEKELNTSETKVGEFAEKLKEKLQKWELAKDKLNSENTSTKDIDSYDRTERELLKWLEDQQTDRQELKKDFESIKSDVKTFIQRTGVEIEEEIPSEEIEEES